MRAAVLGGLLVLAGCGGNTGPLPSASSTDLAFVAAVATWDINRDGNVTCSDWKQYGGALFKDADGDRDGTLSRQEFEAMSRRDRLFATVGLAYFDANGDGRVTLAELADKPNPAFTLLDKNGDCTISSDERISLQSKRPGEGRPSGPITKSGRPGGY